MSENQYDLIVIGAGSGGLTAAELRGAPGRQSRFGGKAPDRRRLHLDGLRAKQSTAQSSQGCARSSIRGALWHRRRNSADGHAARS